MNLKYDISLAEVRQYTDRELEEMLTVSNTERDASYWADCIYWMCVMERNRRNNHQVPDYIEVKCIHNIFDKEGEYVFRLGNRYRMYEVEQLFLIFNDRLRPYLFTEAEDSQWCVGKYFVLTGQQLAD